MKHYNKEEMEFPYSLITAEEAYNMMPHENDNFEFDFNTLDNLIKNAAKRGYNKIEHTITGPQVFINKYIRILEQLGYKVEIEDEKTSYSLVRDILIISW